MSESTSDGTDEVYRYRGVRLTPDIIGYLAPQLFRGQVVKRQDIIRAVVARHHELGGLQSGVSVEGQTKKALRSLCVRGIAEIASAGHYRFALSVGDDPMDLDEESGMLDVEAPALDLAPEREIGVGSEVVYVYFLPAYRRVAALEGEDRWPCKVGYTAGTLLARILGQANTALPEVPVVGLRINGERCRDLEKAIHGVLGFSGRKRLVPGTEWFDTSPAEVERIYESLTAALSNGSSSTTPTSS